MLLRGYNSRLGVPPLLMSSHIVNTEPEPVNPPQKDDDKNIKASRVEPTGPSKRVR